MKNLERLLKVIKKRNWTIGVMESCTGGAIIDSITNIPGASDVFKSGKVTYSDEAKIMAGVDKKVIEVYSVYSVEVAKEMARKIEGEIGVGVTGNLPGMVYMAVRIKNEIKSKNIEAKSVLENGVEARKEMKREVVEKVWEMVIEELVR
jgi:PncC family amidohydrolase